jgi:predicted dithiol-disulfide oxidoreductase (DUF899 family)
MSMADLFGDRQTLVIYSYMFGPEREIGRSRAGRRSSAHA